MTKPSLSAQIRKRLYSIRTIEWELKRLRDFLEKPMEGCNDDLTDFLTVAGLHCPETYNCPSGGIDELKEKFTSLRDDLEDLYRVIDAVENPK